jgi:(E)-4-hydroxy-3-methylbut-2-enyl-diphosphate synthase
MKYCESIFETKRWKTREVKVGNVGVGGDNPVRIQSLIKSSDLPIQDVRLPVLQFKE